MGLDFSFFREEATPAPVRTDSGQNSTADGKAIKKPARNSNAVQSTLDTLKAIQPKVEEQAPALKIQNEYASHCEAEAQRVYRTYQET